MNGFGRLLPSCQARFSQETITRPATKAEDDSPTLGPTTVVGPTTSNRSAGAGRSGFGVTHGRSVSQRRRVASAGLSTHGSSAGRRTKTCETGAEVVTNAALDKGCAIATLFHSAEGQSSGDTARTTEEHTSKTQTLKNSKNSKILRDQ